jgi:hypothetical protein
MHRTVTALAVLTVMLSACATDTRQVATVGIVPVAQPQPVWRGVATPADQTLIDGLAGQWQRALGMVPKRQQAIVSGEGGLLDPKAALEAPDLTPGSYRCRLVRLGGRRGVTSFKPDFCYVDGGADKRSFTKQTGENLPGGWLYSDSATRQVFLGTLRGPGVQMAPPYGDKPAQDVAAVIERVAPFRWRMVVPHAGGGAALDVYELVPVVAGASDPAKKAG